MDKELPFIKWMKLFTYMNFKGFVGEVPVDVAAAAVVTLASSIIAARLKEVIELTAGGGEQLRGAWMVVLHFIGGGHRR